MKTPHKITEEKARFQKYLSDTGLVLTSGRRIIFDQVMCAHGHFAAEELVKKCRQKNKKVSRATIYRGLRELRAAGIIRETAFGEKHQHFEHVYDEKLHHHARCIHCHGIIEFPCFEGTRKYAQLLKQDGFQILGHEFHVYGICAQCHRGVR